MDAASRILIVDDEADARDMLEALLLREGYEFAFAASGPEALAMVGQVSPDAILLDVMMPGMDGIEVCCRLRADPDRGEIPVLLITALDDRDARLRGVEAGADDFISKPVDRLELRTRVRSITRLNRYRRLLWERTRRQEAEEQILQRSRELMLLNSVITTAASTFDLEQILRQACAALAEALGLTQATARLFSEDWADLSLVVQYNSRDTQSAHSEPPIAGPLLLGETESRSPVAVATAAADRRLAAVRPIPLEKGTLSHLAVPILVQGRIVGSVELQAKERVEFSESDLALATSIATAVGQAMENGRLYRELQLHVLGLEETVAQRTLELETERDRTKAILEALGEAVLVADTKGEIRYVNPAAVALTGYPDQELLGQQWDVWQPDIQAAQFHAEARAAAERGQRWSGETVYRRKDGTLYHAAVTVAPFFEPFSQQELAGFVTIHRDITPIKEADRLKDEFISNVSHELRTPLSVVTLVSGNLDTLYDRLTESKRQAMVRDIREHLRVLNDVVEDVLELSRIDSNAMSRERERVNMAELAREEVGKQDPLVQRKAQQVHVVGADLLPVLGNKAQLRQVIRNLLNNAIKYTPRNGTILCQCLVVDEQDVLEQSWPTRRDHKPPGKMAALRIADTGIGVSEQDLPHIFERFYRVKTQGDVPGTGLGLAIAKELVALNEGHLAVVSVPEQGTSFTVLLPLLGEEVQ